MKAPHRIRRLRWNVTSSVRDDGFGARAWLRQMHDTGLLDDIERAFDSVSGGDDIVHIPRLELTMRVAAIEQVGVAVAEEIRRVLVRQQKARPAATPSAIPRESTRERGQRADAADRLIAYLESGLLPWPLANVERQSTLSHLQQAAAAHPDRILSSVPRIASNAAPFVFRWLQLLPRDEWVSIARRVEQLAAAGDVSGLTDAIAALAGAGESGWSDYSRMQLAAAMMTIALCGPVNASAGAGGRAAIAAAFSAIASSPASSPAASPPSPPASGGAPPDTDALGTKLPAAAATWIRVHVTTTDSDAARRSTPRPAERPHLDSTTRAARRDRVAEEPPAVATTESSSAGARPDDRERAVPDAFGLAVDHAGLILIHPFVPQLFQRRGVVRAGDRSLPDDSLARAAALLSYAARGDDEPIEFDLAFVKVLLGRRPETPLPLAAGVIDADDRREVDGLLESVVEHWRALKHTSIGGLRTSFLQRRGLLGDADDGWRLRVEAQSFDLLLDQLPWGISTVKLPWMTAPVFTEWTTP